VAVRFSSDQNKHDSLYQSKTLGRILFVTVVALGIGLALLTANASADTTSVLSGQTIYPAKPALGTPQCSGSNSSITHTTLADFNPGNF
jgi:hypothetical protein